jgi:predicted O-methyltransferase YrrM
MSSYLGKNCLIMDYKDILGSLADSEAELLKECAEQAPLNRFLEIGTFLGKSASVLASVAKEQN